MTAEIAVCLVSGGMDSCVAAAIAIQRGHAPAFLHAGYGQLTQRRELRAFRGIADHYRVDRRLEIDLGHLRTIGGSALTDPSLPLPEGELDRSGVPVSYVPFRNANLLAAAASWAEVLGARSVFIGAVERDGSGYPDCRRPFFDAFERAIAEGTREGGIRIETPLIGLRKKQIVEEGVRLGAPLRLTWSCYQAELLACGRCDSCLLRLRGFREAGVEDPLAYQA